MNRAVLLWCIMVLTVGHYALARYIIWRLQRSRDELAGIALRLLAENQRLKAQLGKSDG